MLERLLALMKRRESGVPEENYDQALEATRAQIQRARTYKELARTLGDEHLERNAEEEEEILMRLLAEMQVYTLSEQDGD